MRRIQIMAAVALASACADSVPSEASGDAALDRDARTGGDTYTSPPLDAADGGDDPCEGCATYCARDHENRPYCAPRCAEDCDPGFECRQVNNAGADTIFVCVPRENRLCEVCEQDIDCGELAACLSMGELERRCSADCSDGFCPEGFGCRQLDEISTPQCVADDPARCASCIDRDGDGYGEGEGCLGADCDDDDLARHAGAEERCDGVDNDCDGATDEDLDGAGEIDCEGVGVCAGAEGRCEEGAWTCRIPPAYQEIETLCDGLDNDCNGLVDDVEGRGDDCTEGIGACEATGTLVCDGRGSLICSAQALDPVAERCNGIDDDCDGLVDNVEGVGEACESGQGACAVIGELLCDPVALRLSCSARERPPAEEICDGRDNDCDGQTDEDLPGCGAPLEEICNGIDDDLDGQIDEGLSRPCQGACGGGEQRCLGGEWGACDAPQPGPELCNGQDDDCDGQIDEGAPCPPGNECAGGRCEAVCPDNDGDGHRAVRCGGDDCDDDDAHRYPGHPEVWDIRDNDCDGAQDEDGLLTLGRYQRGYSAEDWEHRFASAQPAGFLPDGHRVVLYPPSVCAAGPLRALDGCAPINGGEHVQLWGGFTLVALAECTGTLGNHHISLYLMETGGEYTDYSRNPNFRCRRIGYVYGGITWQSVGTAVQFYRHRSGFDAGEVGDNMWSPEPREGDPLYAAHAPDWWSPGGN